MSKKKTVRINDQIQVARVRTISPDGEQLGILPLSEALKKAAEYRLDLVEVSPNANPPVCRIMDYGKYRYEQSKKEKESRKKQHTITIKEIRLRPKTDEHDLETKMRHARKFLEQKNKVKVTIIFRGREMAYQDFGENLMERVAEILSDIARPEGPMKMEGRRMVRMFAPES